MKFKALVLVLVLIASTGCLRRPPTVIDSTSPGYISESACLRLISGQSYSLSSEVKKVSEVKPFSCAESCECNCTASLATAKKVNAALPVSTKTVVKSKPIVSAKPIRTTTVIRKEAAVIESQEKETSARASLKLAPKAETSDSHIREVQEALNRKGAKLEVDGQMGERTVRLLKAFQTMNDLPVTGKADEATAKALGITTK